MVCLLLCPARNYSAFTPWLAGIFCFISILIVSLSNIFHSLRHFIYNFLKPKVMAYATWLTHWMSITLTGRFGDSRPGLTLELTRRKSSVHSGSWDDGSWSSMCGCRVNISIHRRQLCGRGGGFMADLSRLGSEVVGGGGWRSYFYHSPTPWYHYSCPHISCLSTVRNSRPISAFVRSTALSPPAHTFLTSVKLLNWSLRSIWIQQFWNYLPER